MRPEEEFASSCVLEYLGEDASLLEGENPPDCYFVVNKTQIAVEITRLMPVTYDNKGLPKNRTTEDTYSVRLCDELDVEFKDQIPRRLSLCLGIEGPIRNTRRFRRSLRSQLASILESGTVEPGWRKEFDIAGNVVEIWAAEHESPTGRKVIGIVSNEDADIWVSRDALVILEERISSKDKIMSELSWRGPRWLVLLNETILAGPGEYASAYKQLSVIHGFDRVLLVTKDRAVYDLSKEA